MKNTCNIANFNCTFNVNGTLKPLLEYFEEIIFPALTDPNLQRITRKNKRVTAEYFLYDVQLVKIGEDDYALMGKHVKRAHLKIDQDITPEEGIKHIGEIKTSAPYSTFILLLKNHRVIYFKESDQGAPDIRSFAVTAREVISKYIKGKRINLINELNSNSFYYNSKHYTSINDFTEEVLNKQYPFAELNIVPIESRELVKAHFAKIKKINSLSLSIYKLNSELHYDNYFENVSEFANKLGTSKVEQTVKNIDNVKEVQNMVSNLNGQVDYKIKSTTEDNTKVTLTPKDVTESIEVEYDESSSDSDKANQIINNLNTRQEIQKEISSENTNHYNSLKNVFRKLIAQIQFTK